MQMTNTAPEEVPTEILKNDKGASEASVTQDTGPLTPMKGAVMAFWLLVATNNLFSKVETDDQGVPRFVLLPESADLTEDQMLSKFSALLPSDVENPEQDIQCRFINFKKQMEEQGEDVSVEIRDENGNASQTKAMITYASAVGAVKKLFENSGAIIDASEYPSGQLCDSFTQIIGIIPS